MGERVPRIGIVGGGVFGEMHLKVFRQLEHEGRCELVGLADVRPAQLRLRKKQYGVRTFRSHRELIRRAKPDAVAVVTPDHLHRKIAVDALEAGCHVLCEKPLDVTTKGALEMVRAAKRNNRLLAVDLHKRHAPAHISLKQAIAAGKLGKVEYAYAWMEDRIEVPRDWWPEWSPKSSPIWFLGVHYIDVFRWIVGNPKAQTVYATGQRRKLRSEGVNAWDAIQAHVTFRGGIQFTIHVSWILPETFEAIVDQGLRVIGTDGCVELDGQYLGVRECLKGELTQTRNHEFYHERIEPDGTVRYSGYGIDSIAEFCDMLNLLAIGYSLRQIEGRYASGAEAVEVVRIGEAAHKSLATGRPVTLR